MVSPKIEKSIVNFINKSANADDLDTLESWIQDPRNQEILKEYVKTHFIALLAKSNPDARAIRSLVLEEIQKEKQKSGRRRLNQIRKYAAVFIFVLGVSYFFYDGIISRRDAKEEVTPREDMITLQLQDGTVKVIEEEGSAQVTDNKGKIVGKQDGTKLVYGTSSSSSNTLSYNTLTVPYGKRFDLILSDGTHCFLNAGTSLKYPVQFIPGHGRDVYLNGEAYFMVVKDSARLFTVNTEKVDVHVLGTHFNMSNYAEDAHTDVVLVEGSVDLSPNNSNADTKVVIAPGSKASFNKAQGTISTKKVNTSIYTGWVKGDVVFRNAPFKNIVKRLERLYNVTIVNNDKTLGEEIFNASFEVDTEGIDEVLRYFKKVYHIEYKIENSTIVIEQQKKEVQ